MNPTERIALAVELADLKLNPSARGNPAHAGRSARMREIMGILLVKENAGTLTSEKHKEWEEFKSYQDLSDWIAIKAKQYGGRNKFLSSKEYFAIYPIIEKQVKKFKDERKKQLSSNLLLILNEAQLKNGDRVYTEFVGGFLNEERYEGTIKIINDIPYVKTDYPISVSSRGRISNTSKVEFGPRWLKIGTTTNPLVERVNKTEAETSGESKAKEPWEMTRREYEAKGTSLPENHPLIKAARDAQDELRQATKELIPSSNSKEYDVETALKSPKVTKSSKDTYRSAKHKLDLINREIETAIDHKTHIEKAIQEGKPVPPEVLAEYPDLQPKAPDIASPKDDTAHGSEFSQAQGDGSTPDPRNTFTVANRHDITSLNADNIIALLDEITQEIIDNDQKLSPNRAKELAALRIRQQIRNQLTETDKKIHAMEPLTDNEESFYNSIYEDKWDYGRQLEEASGMRYNADDADHPIVGMPLNQVLPKNIKERIPEPPEPPNPQQPHIFAKIGKEEYAIIRIRDGYGKLGYGIGARYEGTNGKFETSGGWFATRQQAEDAIIEGKRHSVSHLKADDFVDESLKARKMALIAEKEAQEQEQAKQQALEKAREHEAYAKLYELTEKLKARLDVTGFKKQDIQIPVSYTKEGKAIIENQTVPAYVKGGLAVHKELSNEKYYTVSHVATGLGVIKGRFSLPEAKLAAARLLNAADWTKFTGKDDISKPEFELATKIALAIRKNQNPLYDPYLDAEEPMPTLDDANTGTALSPTDRVRLAVDLARLWVESKTAVDAERQAAIGRQMGQAKAVLLGLNTITNDEETDEFGLLKSGKKTRERINSQVADLVNQIKAGTRKIESLTSDELALFRQYSGKGGLTDNSQYEYYTPTPIAEGMWDLMEANGFKYGNVLEPSTGAGVFSATKKVGTVITGTEIDPIAATVNQALHKDDIIINQSFEKLAVATPDNFFDSVIGNVPFGDARGASANDDQEFKNEKRIERYFIDRVIDKTRPGGLICLVVPTQVIGNKDGAWQAFRAKISRKAEFLGGHKLPSKTFGKQGTNVVVDIIVMKKHPIDLLDKVDSLPSETLKSALVLWDEFIGGTYWQGEGKKFIKGTYVPPNPDKFRSMEEVIPADGTTPESLKHALAVRFYSRIDWAMIDSQEPDLQIYQRGDRRVINGKDCEFDGIGWNPVLYGDDSTPLDKGKFGASTMAELEGIMGSPASMLAINSAQAFNVLKKYPNMIGEQQKMAIEFAISQPQEKFAEQAYRGSLIGSMVTSYIAKQTAGRAEATDRDALIAVLNAEYALMGHPKSVKGFLLEGEMARYFGAYLGAIDQDGKVSPVITDGIDVATGYKPDNIQSIVDYLLKDGTPTTLDEIKGMYKGNLAIKGLGDIADIDGIAILPSGDITTTKNWCSGEIYLKAAELQSAMEGEQDPRVSDHWNRLTNIMMGKAKRTAIEDIGFGLRDQWIDNSYKLEFFANNGFESIAFASNESVVKTSETGEVYTGTEVNLNSDSPAGEWMTTNRRASKFEEQLAEHYMNGQSIGYHVVEKQGQSADERKAELRTQVNALEEEFKAFMQSHPNFLELENTYNATFNNYVEPDYEISDLGLKDASGAIKLHWYQNQGVRWMSDHGTGILGFDVGLGKAQPLDAKILTPHGWTLMGNINVGDLVISVDGTAVPVIGVFPQGEKEIFEVEFSDGAKTQCCDEHLWFTQTEKDRKNKRNALRLKKDRNYPGSVKSLSEISKELVYQTQPNHQIPLIQPVEFDSKNFAVHPYIMGILLGDGCFRSGSVRYTKGDLGISERICNLLPDGMEIRKVKTIEREDTWQLSATRDRHPHENCIVKYLKNSGLKGALSHEKFIPDEYLTGSVEQRIDLLHGLMDTDGYVSKDGITVQFTSTSKMLATGVLEIVQSLGGISWINTKIPTFTYLGEKKQGKLAYTVSIRMPPNINPFCLERKANRITPKSKYTPVRYFKSVRSVGLKMAQCIKIDHPSHLYVTDDYIVTHNTASAMAYSAYDRQMGRSNKHLIVVPNSVLGNWYMESKRFFGNHNSIMFVGFEPVYNKDGSIKNEPVLDEKGQPKVNAFTNEIEYQDVLRKDSPEEVYAKMHKIPASKVGMVIMTEEKFELIPMREENRIKYADGWAQKNMISNAQLKAIQTGEDLKKEKPEKELRSPKRGKDVLFDATYNEDKQQNRDQQTYSDDGTLKAEQFPFFEDMGFDRIIYDEIHRCKNSFSMSSALSELAYLPNAASAKRARNLAMKASFMREKYNGKGMIGLTATPVTNSPIEIFNMLSLVIDQAEFERMGIYTPDDFVRQFAQIDMVEKIKVSGDIKPTEGLKGFKSLNALRAMFHRYANMKKPADVDPEGNDLKLPTAVEFRDQSPMNDEQSALYVTLRDEARASARKEKGSRSMFSVIRDMDRVTTDIDMYYKRITFIFKLADKANLDKLIADMPPVVKVQFRQDKETGELVRINNKSSKKDDENIVTVEENKPTEYQINGDSITFPCPDVYEDNVMNRTAKFGIEYVSHPLMPKYAKMIGNMQFELDRNGKQIIFTEEKTQHGKIFRLVTNHLPVTPDQVGIINADTASGEKLQQISDAYNQGLIKIVICNKKAEVGVNLQKGTSAIHHLTLPWTPASIQQRNGRGVRQGNTMPEVHVYYYQAMGSFDEYRLDLLKNKAAWIENLMDKNSSEDTAENADATSAMDQMALLAENKEEFLATMQKRKEQKELEEKKRRDKAAVIKLNQLGSIEQALSTYDESLKKALEKAQDDIDKAQVRLDKAKQEGEEPKQIKSLESSLLWAKNKLEKVEPTLKAKKDLMESQKRQTLSLFKGQATKGELPFDIKAAENPLTTILLKNGTLVTKGATFKYKSTIFEIVTVDRIKKEITVKNLVGHGCSENHPYDAQDFLEDAVEVHYTPDEMAQYEWLDGYHDFAGLIEQPKEFIIEHQAKIKYSNEVLWRDVSSSDNNQLIARDSKYRDTAIVYPDPNDRQLTEQLTEMYKNWKITGGGSFNERKFNIYMPVLLGSDWKAQIESTLKIMPDADITAKASAMLSEKIKDFPQSTVEECQLLRKRIEGDYWNEPNCFKAEVKKEMAEFMDAGQYVNNRLEVESIIADVIDNAKVPINNRILELKQQAAQAAIEKLKDSPDYKEVPADIVEKFSQISIDIWYNQEEIMVKGYNGTRKLPPFSTLFLHDKKGFNGMLKTVKDIVKVRFDAEWAKEIVMGSSRHAQSWTIPAKKPLTTEQLESLYNIID